MWNLVLRNLTRRPLRTGLTLSGLAVSVALLGFLLSYGQGYESGIRGEMDKIGMHLMLVPLGCPYDAAAQALRGRGTDSFLPEESLNIVRNDPDVAFAAPMFAAALPRADLNRTDLFVGVDDSVRQMKPYLRTAANTRWFAPNDTSGIVLGAEAASLEMRKTGDRFYSPETGRTFTVRGVLERSGMSDDSLYFVPLRTAQAMFHKPANLTAIAVRLKNPNKLSSAMARLQTIPGAQVITVTELMGTYLNLMGAARSLLMAIAIIAVAISALTVFNTMMAATLERTGELAVLRAVGFGRAHLYALMTMEAVALSLGGGVFGLLLAAILARVVEPIARATVPLAPVVAPAALTPQSVAQCLSLMFVIGLIAVAYPAWQASRLAPAVALKHA